MAVGEREQRMVLAHADVFAGMELRAALTHDDVAGFNRLAAENLHAETLSRRVATVARRAACFLVRHGCVSLARVNRRDLHLGEELAVAALTMRVLAALFLEGDDLLALALFEDLGFDRSARHEGQTRLRGVAADEQNFPKGQ